MEISDAEYAELMELCRGGRLFIARTGEEVPTTLRERIVNLQMGNDADRDTLKHAEQWGPLEAVRRIARAALGNEQSGHAREFLWIAMLYDMRISGDRRLSCAHAALAEGRLDQASALLAKPCWVPL